MHQWFIFKKKASVKDQWGGVVRGFFGKTPDFLRFYFSEPFPSVDLSCIFCIFPPKREQNWWWLCSCSIKTHLEGRGKFWGGEFPNNIRVFVEYGHSIHHQGVHGIILPCRQGRIDSVKSNLFIKMMIEWWMLSRWATTKGIPILSQAVGFLMSDFQPNQILMTPRISYLFCAAIFFCRRRYQHIIKLQSKGFCLWQRISNYLGKRWG